MDQKDKDVAYYILDLVKKGPGIRPVKTYSHLTYNLEKLKVSPQKAMRIINDKLKREKESNTRFNWKMIRFTFYVWERLNEKENRYLKPKIDTIRKVVRDDRFKHFFEAYFPDEIFDEEKEIKLLNKLVAEKAQQKYLKEGYYKHPYKDRLLKNWEIDGIL